MSEKTFKFQMEMTCEGCSGAAERVLKKVGVSSYDISLESQTVIVTSADKTADELLEVLKKTGKEVKFVEVVE